MEVMKDGRCPEDLTVDTQLNGDLESNPEL
jgi:hypothetical protein